MKSIMLIELDMSRSVVLLDQDWAPSVVIKMLGPPFQEKPIEASTNTYCPAVGTTCPAPVGSAVQVTPPLWVT